MQLTELKSKKSLLIILALALCIAVGAGVALYATGNGKAEEPQYERVQVKRGDIVIGFDSDGTIDLSKVNLRFSVRGIISKILVTEGDEVGKGTVIAKLDDRDYQDQYQLALVRLTDAQAQQLTSLLDDELKIKNTELQLQQLRDQYEEMRAIPDAYPANEIRIKEMELSSKEKEYENLVRKHEIQKSRGVQQEELAVKIAKEDLEHTILYAPVAGVVLGLSKKVGENVSDDQDFAVIHENNAVNAVTNVIEYDIAQIKVGQKAYVEVEAIPDKKFEAQVSKISSLPTGDSSGLVHYSVEVGIKDPDRELRDGMTCTVSFVIKEVRDCLIVPYRAVRMVDGRQVVTVVEPDGRMVEKEIKAGFTDGTDVEVLEGLRGNETVIYLRSR